MTARDLRSIKNLYFFHRYLPSSVARIFGVSAKHILHIVHGEPTESVTVIADLECMLCGLEDAQTYYIDGDKTNQKPQNLIMLCEADKRRIQHLQLRKRRGIVSPQMD